MEKAEGKVPEPGDADAVLTHHVTEQWKCSSGEHKMFQKKQESHFLRDEGFLIVKESIML